MNKYKFFIVRNISPNDILPDFHDLCSDEYIPYCIIYDCDTSSLHGIGCGHVVVPPTGKVEIVGNSIIFSKLPVPVPPGYINVYPTSRVDTFSIVSMDDLLDVANGDDAYGYTIDCGLYDTPFNKELVVLDETYNIDTVTISASSVPIRKTKPSTIDDDGSTGNATKVALVKNGKELSESPMFAYDGNVEFFDNEEFIDEATKLKEDLVPLYVLLIRSNSITSKLIGKATGGEFTHASISLDSSLSKLYSFAVNSVDPTQPTDKKLLSINKGGFKEETLKGLQELGNIPYALYVLPVRKRNMVKVRKRLQYFIDNKSMFTYDSVALGKAFFNIADDSSETKFFCSRFVADILNTGSTTPIVDHPSLVRPDDIKYMSGTRYVCSGKLLDYNQRNAELISARVMRDYDISRDYVLDNIVQVRDNAMDTRTRLENKIASFVFSRQNSSDEFLVSESTLPQAMRYFKAFKVQIDNNGDVVINRRVSTDLENHYKSAVGKIRRCRSSGDTEGIKDELCKINYMVTLIDDNYLTDSLDSNTKNIRDLRAKLLSVYTTELRLILETDPDFNFGEYYAKSIYGTQTVVPMRAIANGVKYISTLL